jgi:hypothetical protein
VEGDRPDRRDPGLSELHVRCLDARGEHVAAKVRRAVLVASRCVDHVAARLNVLRVRSPERELLAESGGDVNLADALSRLGVNDVQGAGAEIDVLPAQRERLSDSQSATSEGREESTANAGRGIEETEPIGTLIENLEAIEQALEVAHGVVEQLGMDKGHADVRAMAPAERWLLSGFTEEALVELKWMTQEIVEIRGHLLGVELSSLA